MNDTMIGILWALAIPGAVFAIAGLTLLVLEWTSHEE